MVFGMLIYVQESLKLLGHSIYRGSYKITIVCLSVCLCIHQFSIFLRNDTLFFSDFWRDGREIIRIFKNWLSLFSRKTNFCQIWTKRDQNGPKICFFFIFWKILPLVFLGSNLEWKIILLLIFHHQSHIWQNSGSRVMGQKAVSQSNCMIL